MIDPHAITVPLFVVVLITTPVRPSFYAARHSTSSYQRGGIYILRQYNPSMFLATIVRIAGDDLMDTDGLIKARYRAEVATRLTSLIGSDGEGKCIITTVGWE